MVVLLYIVTSDFRPEVEIRSFRACTVHLAIIIGTVRSLWMWLWGRYHVPQNAFLVIIMIVVIIIVISITINQIEVDGKSLIAFTKERLCHVDL